MRGGGVRSTLMQIWKAIRQLNPRDAVREAEEPFTLALVGTTQEEANSMREFLLGPAPSPQDRVLADRALRTYVQPLDDSRRRDVRKADLIVAPFEAQAELERAGPKLFRFDPDRPELSLKSIITSRRGARLRLPLARRLPGFRPDVARRVVREVSRENAVFVIATALGHVVPNVFQPLLAVTEAAGDTVFLTANQVRMLFLIGAAHGERVGYVAQWREVSSIVGAAFGWRSLARNLVSKIPMGGGLIPKGAIAYAGTTVVGEGLIFFYTTGRHMTRAEVKQAFKQAYARALGTVRALARRERPAPE